MTILLLHKIQQKENMILGYDDSDVCFYLWSNLSLHNEEKKIKKPIDFSQLKSIIMHPLMQ